MSQRNFWQWIGQSRRPARWLAAVVLGLSVSALNAAESAKLKVDKSPLEREGAGSFSYAPVVKSVAPSVVTIYSEHLSGSANGASPLMNDPLLRRFFGDNPPRQRMPEMGLGSGVIISEDGYLLTNNHVVEGADKIMVETGDRKQRFTAKLIGTDPQTDVAVLKVEAKDLPCVTFGDSDQIEVGDVVLAIGNPMNVGQTVSMGIISAVGRDTGILGPGGYENFIQTDAAINQGNSGGPLVDVKGRLIGISQSIASGSGGSDGVGFVIPVNLLRNVAEQLINNGRVSRGFLGLSLQTLTPDLAKAFNIDDVSGALVSEVVPGSPAEKAGLQYGDVIVQFEGKKVDDSAHLRLMASQTAPGTKVDLKIVREGTGRGVTVKLAELPEDLALGGSFREDGSSMKHDGLDGVVVEDLSREARRQLGVPSRVDGALVSSVDPDSNAYEAGLREGDVIVELNHKPVPDADAVVKASQRAGQDKILLRVWSQRGGRPGLGYLVVDNTTDKK